jgi:hypothetical protein
VNFIICQKNIHANISPLWVVGVLERKHHVSFGDVLNYFFSREEGREDFREGEGLLDDLEIIRRERRERREGRRSERISGELKIVGRPRDY